MVESMWRGNTGPVDTTSSAGMTHRVRAESPRFRDGPHFPQYSTTSTSPSRTLFNGNELYSRHITVDLISLPIFYRPKKDTLCTHALALPCHSVPKQEGYQQYSVDSALAINKGIFLTDNTSCAPSEVMIKEQLGILSWQLVAISGQLSLL